MKVLLFGRLADAIGREAEVAVEAGASVAEVRRRLAEAHPEAAPWLGSGSARACLDDEMVSDDRAVPAGAELAFFPPLSGG